jgi:hypothetical protein
MNLSSIMEPNVVHQYAFKESGILTNTMSRKFVKKQRDFGRLILFFWENLLHQASGNKSYFFILDKDKSFLRNTMTYLTNKSTPHSRRPLFYS